MSEEDRGAEEQEEENDEDQDAPASTEAVGAEEGAVEGAGGLRFAGGVWGEVVQWIPRC